MKKVMGILAFVAAVALQAQTTGGDSIGFTDLCKSGGGWELVNMATEKVEDGVWSLKIQKQPYFMFSPRVSINADTVKFITFKMKVPPNVSLGGNILFIRDGEKWDDSRIAFFRCLDDGEWHEYKINMATNQLWNGTVVQIRVCPMYIPEVAAWGDKKAEVMLGDGFVK